MPAEVREELAQEATFRTWQAHLVREPPRYATRVAQRLAIDWLRRRFEEPDPTVADDAEATPWERRVEARSALRVVESVIAGAPDLHRETLRLLYVEERTLEELLEERLRAGSAGDRSRERDLLYKRRTRALSWIRAKLGEAA